MRYRFDLKAFKEAMIQHVTEAIGRVEGRAPRPDYVESKLKDIDFAVLGDRESAIDQLIPERTEFTGRRSVSSFLKESILKF